MALLVAIVRKVWAIAFQEKPAAEWISADCVRRIVTTLEFLQHALSQSGPCGPPLGLRHCRGRLTQRGSAHAKCPPRQRLRSSRLVFTNRDGTVQLASNRDPVIVHSDCDRFHKSETNQAVKQGRLEILAFITGCWGRSARPSRSTAVLQFSGDFRSCFRW